MDWGHVRGEPSALDEHNYELFLSKAAGCHTHLLESDSLEVHGEMDSTNEREQKHDQCTNWEVPTPPALSDGLYWDF